MYDPDRSDRATQEQWTDRSDLQTAIDRDALQHLTSVMATQGVAWTLRSMIQILTRAGVSNPVEAIRAELAIIAGGDRAR